MTFRKNCGLSLFGTPRYTASMKTRPAAALALVGWYLMVPPANLSKTDAYKQPLNRWVIVRSFDTADDCEDFQDTFFESSREAETLGTLSPAHRDYMFATCVASDDPRIKGKIGDREEDY